MLTQIEGYRLSPQQKRVWTLQEGSEAYRAKCAVSLAGPLTPEAIKAALLQVINRHEILRTTFRRVPGIKVPLQVVAEAGRWTWETLDLHDQPRPAQDARVLERFQAIGRAPFDYEQGPLLRALLVSRSASEQVLLLCLPALSADAWTLKNLAREIA